jgi:excisionase family DNA binding protein
MSSETTALLTSKEAANLLRVSTRQLFNLTKPRGPISCVRIGRSVRYTRAALDAWINEQQSQQTTSVVERRA